MAGDTVSVLDIAAMKEVRKITVGKSSVTTGVTYDGNVLLATLNAEDALAIVDLVTDKVEKIPVGKGAHGIVTSPDNKFVYITNMYDNTVSIIDNMQNKVIGTVTVGKIPNASPISFRGQRCSPNLG